MCSQCKLIYSLYRLNLLVPPPCPCGSGHSALITVNWHVFCPLFEMVIYLISKEVDAANKTNSFQYVVSHHF